jgi:hypothetical protein
MPIVACPAVPRCRRALLVLAAAGALAAPPSRAQDAPMLRPGEAIELPAGSITVLGVDIRRGTPTRVTLKLRATAGAQQTLLVDLDTFRLLAAGVPRAPEYATTAERQMSSFLVEKDSAVDFTRVFAIPDKTDDLVLQLRSGGAIERRRLSGG